MIINKMNVHMYEETIKQTNNFRIFFIIKCKTDSRFLFFSSNSFVDLTKSIV